jgi:hypothetical protein
LLENRTLDKDRDLKAVHALEGGIGAWSILCELLVEAGIVSLDELLARLDCYAERMERQEHRRSVACVRAYRTALLMKLGTLEPDHERDIDELRKKFGDQPKKLPQPTPFDLHFGEEMRKQLEAHREKLAIRQLLPGFLVEAPLDEETRLLVGYYFSTSASDSGLFELFEAEGIQFFIPQIELRGRLQGATIELRSGRPVFVR